MRSELDYCGEGHNSKFGESVSKCAPNVLRIRVARRGNGTPPEGRSRHTILC
jgi:hypothetical protein